MLSYEAPTSPPKPWIAGVCSGIAAGLGLDVAFVRVLFLVPAIFPPAWELAPILYVIGWRDGLRGIRAGESLDSYCEEQSLAAIRFVGHIFLTFALVVLAIGLVWFALVEGAAGPVLFLGTAFWAAFLAYRFLRLRNVTNGWTTCPPELRERTRQFQNLTVIAAIVAAVTVLVTGMIAYSMTHKDSDDDDWDDWDDEDLDD